MYNTSEQTRYYDPEIGRFISPDSTKYLDPESIGGLNLYAYCLNNPVMYVDPSGNFVISTFVIGLLISTAVGATIGGIYSGVTAAANDQNVFGGAFWGAVAGGIMGVGAGVASLFLAPVLVGASSVAVGGITFNAGAALAIGASIAFGTGALGGVIVDIAAQYVNSKEVSDLGSVAVSALQWGVINTAGAFAGSLAGPVSYFESGLLSGIFGSPLSAIGMLIDILRNIY